MDPDWKAKNKIPGDTIKPSAQQADPAAVPSPAPPAPGQIQGPGTSDPASPPPSQPVLPPDSLAGPNIYDQYTPGLKQSSNKIVVIIACLVLLVLLGGAGGFFLLNNKSKGSVANQTGGNNNSSGSQGEQQTDAQQKSALQQQSVTVPSDWHTVDTKMGFTVKAPASWSAEESIPTSSKFDNFVAKSIVISDPKADTGTLVGAGTEKLASSNSQSEFEKEITDVKRTADSLAAFGITKDQVKLASSHVSINGKTWLRVDGQIPNQISTTIYLWDNDHAIMLDVLATEQTALDKLVTDYLLPMAASVQIQ